MENVKNKVYVFLASENWKHIWLPSTAKFMVVFSIFYGTNFFSHFST